MKSPLLILPLLALAAGCHNLTVERSPDDDPRLAQARAILAECSPDAEPLPPGSMSRSSVIEFRCGVGSGWEGVPIEERVLNALGIFSFGKPVDPADIALVRPYLAHTNADVRAVAVRVLEQWLADLAVPFPADDPALPADLEAAAEARAAAPAPALPAAADDDSTLILHVAAAMRCQGPDPMPPFAVLTNDIGRLECWVRPFVVDADDSSLRCVQESLGVRYDERDASRASPTTIRARWLIAPGISPDGNSWHAAVGPRLDRLIPTTWQGAGTFPVRLHPPATLAGGAAAPVRLDDLPAYGGALDWEALSFREDEFVHHPQLRIVEENTPNDGDGFLFLSDSDFSIGPASVDLALRPDPATPGGAVLTAVQTIRADGSDIDPAFATNRTLRAEVPLLPGQTALIGARIRLLENENEDRVPVLSSIPLLGELFTSSYTYTNAIETVLLVHYTPAANAPARRLKEDANRL